MGRSGELAKNTLIIFIGRFCTQLLSFFMMPFYTYFISTADYGYVDLIQSYISLLIPIIILRLDSAVFRFLIDERDNKEKQAITITNTILLLSVQIVLFILIALILKNFITINYLIYIVLNIIFMSLSQVFLQLTRGLGDNLGYSIASIMTGVLTVVCNLVFILGFKMKGQSILISTAIANGICTIYLLIRNKLFGCIKKGDKKKLKEMLSYSLPMIPDGLSWWIVNVSDRSIISFVISNAANGIYAVSCKFSNILSTIFQVFNMSWQENASIHINDEDNSEYFTKILNVTYKIFYSICALILVCVPFVFMIMIGNEYQEAYLYVPVLLFANLFNAMANVIGGVYIAKKETKKVARTTVFGALINIVINIIFIKKIGLWAAAFSTLISYMILTLYRYYDVQKYVKMKIDVKIFILTTLTFGLISYIYIKNNFILNIINLFVTIAVALILNRKSIISLLAIVKNKINKKNKIVM